MDITELEEILESNDNFPVGVKKRKRTVGKLIYFSDTEIEILMDNMYQAGQKNFSDFARTMLLTGRVLSVNFDELKKLNFEINKIGVNINQIAKYVNETGEIDKEVYKVLEQEVEELKSIVTQKMIDELKSVNQYLQEKGRYLD
ncbi:TPA: plasmid mobilization relaxosome protein MobC [Streptococcus suis]|nr:plasmid mobilization relaxosome protein MobC [Streptococcus suis]